MSNINEELDKIIAEVKSLAWEPKPYTLEELRELAGPAWNHKNPTSCSLAQPEPVLEDPE